MNVSAQHSSGLKIPFDHQRLDRLMDEAGIDVVLATSKHNVQYLLGGHRANFFDYMDATGITRYLPVFVYPKGAPEKAAYIGHRLEKFQREVNPMWTPETQTSTAGSVDAMQKAVDYMRKAGMKPKRIAAEFGFLPYDASIVLRAAFPDADWVDALYVLERQRAKKSADELAKLKVASEAVLASMQAVIASHGPGATKNEVVEALRREETNRGLTFEYCLITCGTSLNRAPSDQIWEQGRHHVDRLRRQLSTAISATSAAWRSRASRMPSSSICWPRSKAIQRAAMKPVRAGAMGREIYAAAEPLRSKSKHHNHLDFLGHGMGMVSHEAPRLTSHGPVPYPCEYADMPLEAGMVVSVETTLLHSTRGFIKLEDTVVVTDNGHEILRRRRARLE